jgi:hypothetical protein
VIRGLLESLAWRLLRDRIDTYYLPRSNFVDYCYWMSRDFPVFLDAYRYLSFLDDNNERAMSRPTLPEHRERMRQKYAAAPAAQDQGEGNG